MTNGNAKCAATFVHPSVTGIQLHTTFLKHTKKDKQLLRSDLINTTLSLLSKPQTKQKTTFALRRLMADASYVTSSHVGVFFRKVGFLL